MDKQRREPIRVTFNDGKRKQLRAVEWLLGVQALWSLGANPTMVIDDADLLSKVTPDELRKLQARYSYLSHMKHEAEPVPMAEAADPQPETEEQPAPAPKRGRKPKAA